MQPIFKCQKTGTCCSHIRGMMKSDDQKFLMDYGYGKMPLIQLVPIEKISFPLWDFEAKRFRMYEKEFGINAKITPLRAIFDLNENKCIVVTYFIDHDSCPFLTKDKECSIYHTNRAFICRQFPFQHSPFIMTNEELSVQTMFGACPSLNCMVKNRRFSNIKEMVYFFEKAFPDKSFLNSVQNDIVTIFVNKTIVDLIKNKKLRPALNYPYQFLLKRIENSTKIDFFEYLVEKTIKTKEEIGSLIQRFENCEDAKQENKEMVK